MSLITSSTQAASQKDSGTDAITQALGGTELGQMFTKLLVAQVQYQDPLEPTDSSTFITQLTQLSQTESLQSLQSQLSTQSSILDSLQTMQLGSQVGSQVMVHASSVLLESSPVRAMVNLEAGAQLQLQLTGADGKLTTMDLGTHGSGDVAFAIDPHSLGLPAGRYDIAVVDANDSRHAVEVVGRLDAVRLTAAGTVALQVQGLGDVSPTSISRFAGQAA
ncbi:flagellar hook capping FlgD N-terminal domain-containing protein [Comamonas sp.]